MYIFNLRLLEFWFMLFFEIDDMLTLLLLLQFFFFANKEVVFGLFWKVSLEWFLFKLILLLLPPLKANKFFVLYEIFPWLIFAWWEFLSCIFSNDTSLFPCTCCRFRVDTATTDDCMFDNNGKHEMRRNRLVNMMDVNNKRYWNWATIIPNVLLWFRVFGCFGDCDPIHQRKYGCCEGSIKVSKVTYG